MEDIFKVREDIKFAYKKYMHYIIEAHSINKKFFFNPDFFNWFRIFTPIESRAWCQIRASDCVVLYPQYPVDKYFIDFGNPFLKVGLEVDGKMHNREKDIIRDENLQKLGWKIFHVAGRECLCEYKSIIEIEEMGGSDQDNYDLFERFYMNTLEGVVKAIGRLYFGGYGYDSHLEFCYRTLLAHSLIDGNELPCV
jgi:very-short-patch-repair endonuclease